MLLFRSFWNIFNVPRIILNSKFFDQKIFNKILRNYLPLLPTLEYNQPSVIMILITTLNNIYFCIIV